MEEHPGWEVLMSPGSMPATPFLSFWGLAICRFHKEAEACRHTGGHMPGIWDVLGSHMIRLELYEGQVGFCP